MNAVVPNRVLNKFSRVEVAEFCLSEGRLCSLSMTSSEAERRDDRMSERSRWHGMT